MLRDRVGQGNTALAPDGAMDGTLTVTLSAPGGRTVTALRLDSNAPGTWDTSSNDPLGIATRRMHRDRAGAREFARVADEVREHLAQPVGIGTRSEGAVKIMERAPIDIQGSRALRRNR